MSPRLGWLSSDIVKRSIISYYYTTSAQPLKYQTLGLGDAREVRRSDTCPMGDDDDLALSDNLPRTFIFAGSSSDYR